MDFFVLSDAVGVFIEIQSIRDRPKYQDSKKSRFSSVEMIAAGISVVSEYTIIRRPNTEIC